MASYWRTSDTAAAVDGISKLKGIGPATASLLLSVHDPEHVIFFSDEAFWWLCCGGKKDVIKYNTKEYKELNQSVQMLAKRLDVGATDIEKVAYVLMKDERSPTRKTTEPISPPMTKSAAPKGKAGVKRKEKPEGDDKPGQPLRRSKRGKQS